MLGVEIEATNLCNTHCLHCPREAITRPSGRMSWETFQTVSGKVLKRRDIGAVHFSGMGEPLLNPLLPRFVSRLSSRMETSVTTNAAALTKARAQALVDAGLTHFIVSFNGHTADLYGQMMGGLSLEKADTHIRDLMSLADGKAHVLANVSVAQHTRPHLPAIRAHLEELGITEIGFSMCHNRGGYLCDPSICDTPLAPVGKGRCDIFADTLFVAWDGKALACCHDLEGKGEIGDLVREDLETILAKRRCISQQGVRFPMCKDCNDMYRYANDPTPDGRPLSEWVYSLYASDASADAKLMEIIRQQERRINELDEWIRGYEQGRFMRLAGWVRGIARRVRGGQV